MLKNRELSCPWRAGGSLLIERMCSLILSLEMRVPSIDIYHRIRNPSMDEKVELQYRLRWLPQGSISKVSQSMVDALLELYPIVREKASAQGQRPLYSTCEGKEYRWIPMENPGTSKRGGSTTRNPVRLKQELPSDLLAPSCFNGRSRGLQRDIRAKKGLQPQGVASVPDNCSSSSNFVIGRKARKPKAMIYTCFLPKVDVEKRALMQRDALIMNILTIKIAVNPVFMKEQNN
ncbi:hypothetical protein Tco_0373542 [Tanacetum coccineum]